MVSICSIGVDSLLTPSAGLGDLSFCGSDSAKIYDTLSHFDKNKRSILLNSETDKMPTRLNIIKSVFSFSRETSEPIILYYAGHGITINGEFYLVPYDFDISVAKYTAIPLSLIIDIISDEIPWAILLFDACRTNGRLGRSERGRGRLVRRGLFATGNVCIVSSCGDGENAIEAPAIHGVHSGGIFTHFFVEAVRESLAAESRVSMGRIFSQLRDQVSSYAVELDGRSQTPQTFGIDINDLYLV